MISWCTHLLHCPSHVLPQCFRAGPFVLPLVWCEVRAWLWINLGKRAACASTMVKKRWCSERCFLCVYIILYVFLSIKIWHLYTLITSMGKKMWKQVIFQQPGAHLTSARARTLGSAAPLPWWWSTCGGRCGSRDAGTAMALIRSKKEVQLPNQVSW